MMKGQLFSKLPKDIQVLARKKMLKNQDWQDFINSTLQNVIDKITKEDGFSDSVVEITFKRKNKESLEPKIIFDFEFLFDTEEKIQKAINTIANSLGNVKTIFSAKDLMSIHVIGDENFIKTDIKSFLDDETEKKILFYVENYFSFYRITVKNILEDYSIEMLNPEYLEKTYKELSPKYSLFGDIVD